ncbi:MAG: HEAT repeat domain-containing protein [Akkermansiaceae bacterium]|nr:HEAT repeat domain-containing protein [Akkermansiaceae bacterium]
MTRARQLERGVLKLLVILMPFASAVLVAQDSGGDDTKPPPLTELLERIPEVASPGSGMNAEEQALAEAIARHGRTAASPLIAMLESEDAEIYQLVTYCLCSLKNGDFVPGDLEPMARAEGKRRGWLPNAIADIDTDEAATFLAKEFRRQPETMAQIDNALERMAPRSVAPLLREFRMASSEETDFLDGLASVWRECGDRAASAVDPLTMIALDSAQPLFRRKAAVRYLGALGPSSRSAFPRLRSLAERESADFAEAVSLAIADSRTPEAADILIDGAIAEARASDEVFRFRELATMIGPKAKHLADRLVTLLDDPNPNVRLGACRTLGYLDNPDVWPHLCRMLKAQDWRIAYSAALSLAQLGAKGGRPSLEFCRDHHWYPRVRYAAGYALRRLAGEKATELDRNRLGWDFNSDSPESCFGGFDGGDGELRPLDNLPALPGLARTADGKALETPYRFAHPADREYARFITENEGYSFLQTKHPDLYQAIKEGAPEAVARWWFNPDVVGIEREGATTLVGIDSGGEEHGGIFAIEAGEKAKQIVKDFTVSLLRWNGNLIVLSGLEHMMVDYGRVHRLVRDGEEWKTEFLYALPGCPRHASVLADGRLFANCEGGAVAITPSGEFEYLGSGKKEPAEEPACLPPL